MTIRSIICAVFLIVTGVASAQNTLGSTDTSHRRRVTNALGMTYELQVIAATVIGGANLMGGQAYALGAPIGAALVEVIRNSLLLAGVDPYWQGMFLGGFIILAVLLEKLRGSRDG